LEAEDSGEVEDEEKQLNIIVDDVLMFMGLEPR
jgi:hypothetical protein